ncbi:MAG: Uma2 family endonuclease [Deltaproteobacteria bacterium]|nr:Uma2 family endonuclease [Deltaproteobacteria bacterium]
MSAFHAMPGPYRLTFADWLAFPDENKLYEILHGEVVVSPPPSIRHQMITWNLERFFDGQVVRAGLGVVLHAPVGVKLTDEDVLEPDIVLVLSEHRGRIGEQAILGAPDLVVEILSRGTAGRDLGPKRVIYAAAGVPEYWIVDPESTSVEVLVLEGGGYTRVALLRKTDVLRSPLLPGFEVPLRDVFPD